MVTTNGGVSNDGSRRIQQLVRLGTIFCVATVATALGLPSGAAANTTSAKQRLSEEQRKHSDRGKGERRHNDSPASESPAQDSPSDGSPAGGTTSGSENGQPVSAFQFPVVKVRSGVATFRLRGVAPNSIRSAYLRRGEKKRRLSLSRVRRAARRGVLRLNIAGMRGFRRSSQASVSRRRTKPTLVVVTNPTPTPAPAPTPAPTPTPTPTPAPASSGSWRPAGSPPLSDAQARALVTAQAETRPGNFAANHYVPTGTELAAFHAAATTPLLTYVSGGFTGTTDEIIQWAASKWGIPVDVLRAAAVMESYWNQDALGDRRDGVNASLYPAQARIDADSAYESMGLTQIKWRPDGSQGLGTEPLRWKSTAFNADFWGASIRYYFDGYCNWCGSGYGPGQEWPSIGAHFSPVPWQNAGAQNYAAAVQQKMTARTWQQSGF